MPNLKTAKDLDLYGHEAGYEWEAGQTPPGDSATGTWLVRRTADSWVVIFRSAAGPEYEIMPLPATDNGERVAKVMALKLVDIAWGREERWYTRARL